MRLRELAAARDRYGDRRLHVRLRREVREVNAKGTYRPHLEEGLSIRAKPPRHRRASRYRLGRTEVTEPNQVRAMDFLPDALFDGRAFRILTIAGCRSRESLAIVPRTNVRAHQLVEVLDRLVRERGKPKPLRCGNGPEFAGRLLDQWAYLTPRQFIEQARSVRKGA